MLLMGADTKSSRPSKINESPSSSSLSPPPSPMNDEATCHSQAGSRSRSCSPSVSLTCTKSPQSIELESSLRSTDGYQTIGSLAGSNNDHATVNAIATDAADAAMENNPAEAAAANPLADLTRVSAEEDSAFKNYITSHDDDDDDDDDAGQSADCSQISDQNNNESMNEESSSGQAKSEATADKSDPTCETAANDDDTNNNNNSNKQQLQQQRPQTVELRLLVRRREAGALIGKKGSNIKRLRESFRSSMFSIPDTGNGPERVVCITTDQSSIDSILADITRLLVEKSPENDEQVELKLLIHSSHAGSIIGIGGQSIKKLRNESKAAIKIYEMCCPLSNERVCAIKAKPPIVANTIKLIQSILYENPAKGTIKPYDALHFDLNLVDKYGGYLPEDANNVELFNNSHQFAPMPFVGHEPPTVASCHPKHFAAWRAAADFCDPCGIYESHKSMLNESFRYIEANQGPKQAKPKLGAAAAAAAADEPSSRASPARPSARFHPYAANHSHNNHNNQPAQANGHYGRSSAPGQLSPPVSSLHCPSFTAIHAGHQQPQQHQHHHRPRLSGAAYSAPSGHFRSQNVRHQFVSYAGGAVPAGIERCQHIRPCLCMFLPLLPNHNNNHHHHHHQPQQQQQQQHQMLTAYAQMPAAHSDHGEEFNFQNNDQQQQQQQQQQPSATSSSNKKM